MYHDNLLQKFHNVIYRKGPLVYIPTLKNACSYYRSVCIYNSWNQIRWDDIDWSSDHVFSFISDPTKRYFKGLAQDVFNIYFEEDKQVFNELLKYSTKTLKDSALVLTYHSLPLYTIYNELVNKIDWIPLGKNYQTNDLLKILCDNYDIKINFDLDIADENKSTPQQIAFYEELYKNVSNLEENIFYNLLLTKDIELFDNVINRFNLQGKTWEEISWIRKNVKRT